MGTDALMLTEVSVLAVFGAGVASFLSPCLLPLVPAYVGYMTGVTQETERHRRTVLAHSAVFILGFTTIFVLLGLAASAIGQALLSARMVFQTIGGIVLVLFGLWMVGVFKWLPLMRERRLHLKLPKNVGYVRSFGFGTVFAFGWTPCVGPLLAAVLVLAGASGSQTTGALLLAVYALGIAVPFLVVAALLPGLLRSPRFRRFSGGLQKFSGVVLIVIGTLLTTNQMAPLATGLNEIFKDLGIKLV